MDDYELLVHEKLSIGARTKFALVLAVSTV